MLARASGLTVRRLFVALCGRGALDERCSWAVRRPSHLCAGAGLLRDVLRGRLERVGWTSAGCIICWPQRVVQRPVWKSHQLIFDSLSAAEVKYADFFAPPSKPPSGAAKRAHAKAQKAAGGGKAKGKAGRRSGADDMELEDDLDEDEKMEVSEEDDDEEEDEEDEDEDEGEDDEEMEDDDEEAEEEEAFGARKGKTDLFADDDEAEETDTGTPTISFLLGCTLLG